MMKSVLLAAGAALALSQAPALAQPATQSAPTPQTAQNVQQKVRSDLQNEGFSDIHVMPESFTVRAKDKAGNPVMMVINPDSFTEVTTYRSDANGTAQNNHETFMTVPHGDKLSSNLVGLSVYNTSNQDIGTIKDIAVGPNGTQAYILGVGGFLGMGDHYVAVNPSALNVSYDANGKKWHATMNATADQLKSAPEFKYSGAWSANKG
jgi:glucose/arabinose dehydrogenase